MNSSNSHRTYFYWNWISPVERRTQSCELAFIWKASYFYEDQRNVEINPFIKLSWNDIVGFLDFGRDYYDHPRLVVKFYFRHTNFFIASKFNIDCPLTSMASKTALPYISKIASNQCICSKDWWEVWIVGRDRTKTKCPK